MVDHQRRRQHQRQRGRAAHDPEDGEDLAPALGRVVVGHQREAGDVGGGAGHPAEDLGRAERGEVSRPGGDHLEQAGDDRAEPEQRHPLVPVGVPAEPDGGEDQEESDGRLDVQDVPDVDLEIDDDVGPGQGEGRPGQPADEAEEGEHGHGPRAVGSVTQRRPVAGQGPEPLDVLPEPLLHGRHRRSQAPSEPLRRGGLRRPVRRWLSRFWPR